MIPPWIHEIRGERISEGHSEGWEPLVWCLVYCTLQVYCTLARQTTAVPPFITDTCHPDTFRTYKPTMASGMVRDGPLQALDGASVTLSDHSSSLTPDVQYSVPYKVLRASGYSAAFQFWGEGTLCMRWTFGLVLVVGFVSKQLWESFTLVNRHLRELGPLFAEACPW